MVIFCSAYIVLNAKFDTYPMRKTIPSQENAGLVADDFFEINHYQASDSEGAKHILTPYFNRE